MHWFAWAEGSMNDFGWQLGVLARTLIAHLSNVPVRPHKITVIQC